MSIVVTILHAALAVIVGATNVTTPPATAPVMSPTTAPANAAQSLMPALALLGFGLVCAVFARVFRQRSVEGPIRLAGNGAGGAGGAGGALPILIVTLLGGGVWLGSQVFYGAAKAQQFQRAHPGAHFTMDELGDADFAFLSTVPAGVGLLILLAGDIATKMPRQIGYTLDQLPGGIVRGVIGAVISLPIVWGFTVFLSAFYEVTHIEHPGEHELLKVMKESAPHLRWIMVIGACVAAPVFEEMLFRGHIQTLIVRLLNPPPVRVEQGSGVWGLGSGGEEAGNVGAEELNAGVSDAEVLDAEVLDSSSQTLDPGPQTLPLSPETLDPRPQTLPRSGRWIAIFATSFLFAIVHPLWMAPAIFVLAICLGYSYERTGNLWVPILIHAAFNTSSTLVFLNPS